jgi:hypothetical protein
LKTIPTEADILAQYKREGLQVLSSREVIVGREKSFLVSVAGVGNQYESHQAFYRGKDCVVTMTLTVPPRSSELLDQFVTFLGFLSIDTSLFQQ